jgi:hypothetical protein
MSDLTLSPETIQEYSNAADRNLTAPSLEENPSFHQGKEAGLGTWTEIVKIHDTDMANTKGDPGNDNKFNFVIVMSVQGPDVGGSKTNAGRTHYEYAFIDKTALASTDTKASGPFKRRLATVNSLLSSCGIDLAQGVSSYKALFTGDKPLVGNTVAAVMRKYRNTRTGDTGVSIDGFMPLNAG